MKQQTAIRFLNESSEEAVIEIYGQIGQQGWSKEDEQNTARLMSQQLDRIRQLKSKRILVRINSLGGDVNHALAIHDLLAEHPAFISTQINGLCASAATIIAMAATDRRMSRNALMLIHQCSAYVGRANCEQLQQELESQQSVNNRLEDIYAQRCNISKEEIHELMRCNGGQGKWLDADQAKEIGLVTDIYNDTRKAAVLPMEDFANSQLPALPDGYGSLLENSGESSLLQNLAGQLSTLIATLRQPQNQTPMKETYPHIHTLAHLADDATADSNKGCTLSADQLTAIEQQLSQNENLQKEKTELEAKLTEKSAQLEQTANERDNLQKLVDALPAQTPAVQGPDTKPKANDDIANYVNTSPLYQNLRHEI